MDNQNPLGSLTAIAQGEGFNMDIAMMLFKSFIVPMLLGYQPTDENFIGYRGKALRAKMDMEKTQSLMQSYSINPLTLSLVSKVGSLLGAENPMSWALDPTTGKPTGISNMLNQYMNQAFSAIGMSMPDMGMTIGMIRQSVKGLSRPGEEYGLWGEGLDIGETTELYNKIMKGTFRDEDQNQLWGAFNHKDMVEMLQLSREMGVYKNTNISKIPDKLFEFSGILEKGMTVFGTNNKQEALQNILELTGGETDILETGKLTDTLNRLNNLSELTNISVDIIKKVLETSSGISKSLGMTTATGNQIGLNTFETIRILNSLDSSNFLTSKTPISDPTRLSSLITYNAQLLARPESQATGELLAFSREIGGSYNPTTAAIDMTQDDYLAQRRILFEEARKSKNSKYAGKSLHDIEMIYLAERDNYKKLGAELISDKVIDNYTSEMEKVVTQAQMYLDPADATYQELSTIRSKIHDKVAVGPISKSAESLIQKQLGIYADTYKLADATDIWNIAADRPQHQARQAELKKNQTRRDLENDFLNLGAVKELSPIYGSLSNFFESGDLSQLIYMYATRPQGLPLYTRSQERLEETKKLSSYFSYIPEFRHSLMAYSKAYGNIIDTPERYNEIVQLLNTSDVKGDPTKIEAYKKDIEGMTHFTLEQAETKIKQAHPEAKLEDIYLAWKDVAPKKFEEQKEYLALHKPQDMVSRMSEFETKIRSMLSSLDVGTPEKKALTEAIRMAGGADRVRITPKLDTSKLDTLNKSGYQKFVFSKNNQIGFNTEDVRYKYGKQLKEIENQWDKLDKNTIIAKLIATGDIVVPNTLSNIKTLEDITTKEELKTLIQYQIGDFQGYMGYEGWDEEKYKRNLFSTNLTPITFTELIGSYSDYKKDIFKDHKTIPQYDKNNQEYDKYYGIKEKIKNWDTLDVNAKREIITGLTGVQLDSSKQDVEVALKKSINTIQEMAGYEQWGQKEFNHLTDLAVLEYSKQLEDKSFNDFKATATYKDLSTYMEEHFNGALTEGDNRFKRFQKATTWEAFNKEIEDTSYEKMSKPLQMRVKLALQAGQSQERVAKALESKQQAMLRQQRDEFETKVALVSKDQEAYTKFFEEIKDLTIDDKNKVYNILKYYDPSAQLTETEKTSKQEYFEGSDIEKKTGESTDDYTKRKAAEIKRRKELQALYPTLEAHLGSPQAIIALARELDIKGYTAKEMAATINVLTDDKTVKPAGLKKPEDYRLTDAEAKKEKDYSERVQAILEKIPDINELEYITKEDTPKQFDQALFKQDDDKDLLDKMLRREISQKAMDTLLPHNELLSQIQDILNKTKYAGLPETINGLVAKLEAWFKKPKVEVSLFGG